jgi:hypothetical protein
VTKNLGKTKNQMHPLEKDLRQCMRTRQRNESGLMGGDAHRCKLGEADIASITCPLSVTFELP